ncbi:unnamed protein product, partial [Didymodactylos carnosus]
MYQYYAVIYQLLLYLGIIALVIYLFLPLQERIEQFYRNKVVWITGASSGIGLELVKHLAVLSPTTKLVLSSRREDELEKIVEELKLDRDRCLILPLDLEYHGDLFKSKVDLVLDRFDHIDILINNAGISQRSLIKDTQYSVDQRLMSINYLGTVTLSKSVLEHFIAQKHGHFVVVSSVSGYVGTPSRSTYAASKHALHGFFDALRFEHEKDNIHVTVICPGYIRTKISENAFS